MPLVFNVNLYSFIKGNLRFLLKSRKLLLKQTKIDPNYFCRTVSYGFLGLPGAGGPEFPGPQGSVLRRFRELFRVFRVLFRVKAISSLILLVGLNLELRSSRVTSRLCCLY